MAFRRHGPYSTGPPPPRGGVECRPTQLSRASGRRDQLRRLTGHFGPGSFLLVPFCTWRSPRGVWLDRLALIQSRLGFPVRHDSIRRELLGHQFLGSDFAGRWLLNDHSRRLWVTRAAARTANPPAARTRSSRFGRVRVGGRNLFLALLLFGRVLAQLLLLTFGIVFGACQRNGKSSGSQTSAYCCINFAPSTGPADRSTCLGRPAA